VKLSKDLRGVRCTSQDLTERSFRVCDWTVFLPILSVL